MNNSSATKTGKTECDVYDLVTKLCKRLIDKHTPEEHAYLPQKDNKTDVLKRLRSKAFEILLKKSPKSHNDNARQKGDPVLELLKHSFVLKTEMKNPTRAKELESSLDELIKNNEDKDPAVYSSLQFLIGLKSYKTINEDTTNVFHYGRPNPILPEMPQNPKQVPQYQIYPPEALVASEKFEAMLGIKESILASEICRDPQSTCSFRSHFGSTAAIGIEILGNENGSSSRSAPRIPSSRDFSMASYFVPDTRHESDNELKVEYSTGHMGSIPGHQVAWLSCKSPLSESGCDSLISMTESTNVGSINEQDKIREEWSDAIWENVINLSQVSEHRTWECLGRLDAPKEPPFITETNGTMLHLERLQQIGYNMLLPEKFFASLNPIKEIPAGEFMKNVQLLLLGVESSTFHWDDEKGFSLLENSTISGLSVEALKSCCTDLVYWGACYRRVSALISPDPQTGKMNRSGLIFQAMCNSVKEFLLYYQASMLRISVATSESAAFLNLLKTVRPLGHMISEVARLCRCDPENAAAAASLREGLGLFSYIYDEATRITHPRVALVFYSILKSCCEVYFRLLQKWFFEGTCEDEYGEFMIKVRARYLRDKCRTFWNAGYGINMKSVPGFLDNLAEPILQCGKTVRLLKICDPKNPLCSLFATSHPSVRVCLSVGTIREQEIHCREFYEQGEKIIGPASFAFAFEEQKAAEKLRADLVINAQRGTLARIKREREEAVAKNAQNKRELLAELKDQAEEAATRKQRVREAELIEDKRYLEDMNAADEIARCAELAEKQNVLKYYNDLAAEVEMRSLRADWRAKRMKLFQQRMEFIQKSNSEMRAIDEVDVITDDREEIPEISAIIEDENQNVTDDRPMELSNITETPETPEILPIVEDVNQNVTPVETRSRVLQDSAAKVKDANCNFEKTAERPRDLNLKTATAAAAVRNKLKVLEEEYGMTPNNNELKILGINPAIETNVNKNTRHRAESWMTVTRKVGETEMNVMNNCDELTDAQRNRTRNMSHTYLDALAENVAKVNFADYTDLQKNRARMMGHENRNYEEFVADIIGDDCLDPLTPMSGQLPVNEGATPMSCTTDTFPQSMSNSLAMQLITDDNDDDDDEFYKDGARSATTTSADLLNEDPPESRLSQAFPNFFGNAPSTAVTPTTSSSLTIADVEMLDDTSLRVYLEKSVVIPLRVQSRLANAAIIKYLLYEKKMLSHLHSLRSFYFLLNGEFAKSLTNSLYKRLYEISTPIELFRSATLTNILETALNSSLSSTYANSELLSLSAAEIPEALCVSDPEFLNCLCLNYKIAWPLNIILDDRVMLQYSRVFKFLLMVGRVLYVLQEDFHLLKVERKAAMSDQYHKLQLYRHSMMQFITALHNYLTCSVLHESWTQFEKELRNVTTIDQIHQAHVTYIKKILSRCMLTERGEKMRTFLCNIFKVILKFHNRVRSQCWSGNGAAYAHANFERLENMYKTFCDARTYLAHVANKLASSGYQPHLAHFLNALNINPLYDLTDMTMRKS